MYDLVTIFHDPGGYSKYFPVPAQTVQKWMGSSDVKSLSLTYELITDLRFTKGIEPPLHFEEIYSFSLQFLARCIKEDPRPEAEDLDTYTRHRAGDEILHWFNLLWKNEVRHNKLEGFKRWIEKIMIDGDAEIRNCIYCTVVEHLDKRARRFFRDWLNHPVLKTALK